MLNPYFQTVCIQHIYIHKNMFITVLKLTADVFRITFFLDSFYLVSAFYIRPFPSVF